MIEKSVWLLPVFILALLFPSEVAAERGKTLTMATTTSTDNTGLLDYLAPKFQKATGIELKWTATGTGKALKLGENCDVDILMVHAPNAEKRFIQNGFGTDRREIMVNDFVIIGPENDRAKIKGKSIEDAFGDLRARKATFISRGDNSGTYKKEVFLWKTAGLPIPDKEPWYVQTGQGMLSSIQVAAERNGYTMTDRGTYIKYESNWGGNPPLKILVEGDKALLNQYSVIAVNPVHCPAVGYDEAKRFVIWITGKEAQRLIKNFKLLGKPLFVPNAAEKKNSTQ